MTVPRTGHGRDVPVSGSGGDLTPFHDRSEAGVRLAERLRSLDLDQPLVLALPRGGVAVAYELARELDGRLDVLLTRKIGYPYQPELGVGAIAETGEPFFDQRILAHLGLTEDDLQDAVVAERAELDRRVGVYRGGEPMPSVAGRDVVVADDGIATGATARAALRAVRRGKPRHLVLAAPVGAAETVDAMRDEADTVMVLAVPTEFRAVGQWYRVFDQLSDEDVVSLLSDAGAR